MNINANDIVEVFNSTFEKNHHTILRGGAAEPYYQVQEDQAVIYFREDFRASALHEVAHWCLAGAARRRQNDYGYWYEGQRDAAAQQRFEAVEARPQALEWMFSRVLNIPFRASADNLALPGHDTLPFRRSIQAAAVTMLERGLNPRARQFAAALSKLSGLQHDAILQPPMFQELPD